jgi:hypothetical protein
LPKRLFEQILRITKGYITNMIGFILIFVGNNKPCGLINKRLKACYLSDFKEGLWFTVRPVREEY